MRIKIITPIKKGGPYYWGLTLAEYLRKEGHTVEVVNDLKGIIKSIFIADADIVHTTLPISFRFWRKPLILTIKGNYKIEKPIYRKLYDLAIKMATKVTSSSKYVSDAVGLGNAPIIFNGVDLERFKHIKRHKKKDKVRICMVTKLAFPKKAEGVLKVMDILKLCDDYHFTVVGGGPLLDQIKKNAITKEAFGHTEFVGMVKKPEHYVGSSDIFIYYSEHDNFPNAVLEAMAQGVPVVVNDIGAIHEMIENGKEGFICKYPIDFAKKIQALQKSHGLRWTMGEAARKKVEEVFDWNKIVKDYIKVYEEVR